MIDLATYPRQVVQNALTILENEDAVHKVDPERFDVISLRTPSRRVRVLKRGDTWRCRVDKGNNQDRPCSHIVVALLYEGLVEMPNSGPINRKGNAPRSYSLETEAWQRVPVRVPQLLARLLRDGLPLLAPDQPWRGGRPRTATYALVYQAVMRVAWRQSLRASRGAMRGLDHVANNPYGEVGASTASRFLSLASTTQTLEKLLALSTWPVKPYETLAHPDGTGLTEQRFSSYFDERYASKKRGMAPRKHRWTYTEILWTYRYTMVAALYTQQGPFGEAPWLIPLLERARLMLDIQEVGGDKAYDSNAIYKYANEHGIEAQIKIRGHPFPNHSHHGKKYRKAHMIRSRLDASFDAKANRRNNAETGNHAFKAIVGDQIYSKGDISQRNEVLCMCIAYNLTRLVYLEVKENIEVNFTPGAQALATAPWVPLETLHAQTRSASTIRPEWGPATAQA